MSGLRRWYACIGCVAFLMIASMAGMGAQSVFGLNNRADDPPSGDITAPTSDTLCEAGGPAADTDLCINKDQSNITTGNGSIFTKIISAISLLVGAFSVIMVAIGGLRYILSQGDSNALSDAKNTMTYALIGLVIAIFAQAIVTLVLNTKLL